MHQFKQIDLDSDPRYVDALVERARVQGRIAIDTETFGDRPLLPKEKYAGLRWALGDRPFMATFAADIDAAFYTYDPGVARRVLDACWNLIEQPRLLFHNSKFDLHMLRCWPGCDWIPGGDYDLLYDKYPRFGDTMLEYAILFPGQRKALKIASQEFVTADFMDVDGPQKRVHASIAHLRTLHRERIGRKWVLTKQITFKDVPKEIMVPYATQDVILTLMVADGLGREWANRRPQLKPNYDVELELVPLLIQMEQCGEDIDAAELQRQLAEASEERAAWRSRLALWTPADPNKSAELRKFLFTTDEKFRGLGERVKFFTEGKEPSTDELSLRSLENVEVREILLHWRWWNKAYSKLNELSLFTRNGKVHCDLKQDGAKTGRFSAVAPALQNIPRFDIKKVWAWCRKVFAAWRGFYNLYIDYSAIEMRIFADFSKDSGLIATFNSGGDPHKYVTSLMYGVPQDQVTKLQRDFGKTMSFTILYGGGKNRVYESLAFGAAASDPLPTEEAAKALVELQPYTAKDAEMMAMPHRFLAAALLDKYREAIPSAVTFRDDVIKVVKARAWPVDKGGKGRGYVTTRFGREVTVPPEASHIAVNALIQGTAADVLKRAMLRSYKKCKQFCLENGYQMWRDLQMNLSIHDEIKFRPSVEIEAKKLVEYLRPTLTTWPEFPLVNFKVEAKWGFNWAEARGLE